MAIVSPNRAVLAVVIFFDGRSRGAGGRFGRVHGPQPSHASHHGAVLRPTGSGSEFSILYPPLVLETV
jgi:hypothetical protein